MQVRVLLKNTQQHKQTADSLLHFNSASLLVFKLWLIVHFFMLQVQQGILQLPLGPGVVA